MRYAFVLACLLVAFAAGTVVAAQVTDLTTDYLQYPLGIDSRSPAFAWQMQSGQRGARQTAYQVLVATAPRLLLAGKPDMWDTGKMASDHSIGVAYEGKPLASRTTYYWMVRVWNDAGVAADSIVSTFESALLDKSDWSAKWISGPSSGGNGYHSEFGASIDDAKWVQIDLAKPTAFLSVTLYPARPYNWEPDCPGFGFPVRYRIEASDDPDFASGRTIADRTSEDQPNPGTQPVTISVGDQTARYIRITAVKLDQPSGTKPLLALAEMEVTDAAGRNVALDAAVDARDSIEDYGWSKSQLVDGSRISQMAASDSPIFRREFDVAKPIARARAYVTGIGYYEFYLNGRKAGDRVLDPARTDYEKRVCYSTYDITDMLRQGRNCAGAMLGEGWWRKGPRFLVQMEITYKDGATQRIVSDDSWKWSKGPIIENSIYNGETYDARLNPKGWDKAGFDDSAWKSAKIMDWNVPLSAQMIQPIKEIAKMPVKSISSPKPGIYVVDFGQNFSGWCRLKASASAGTKITLKYAELLHQDGTVNQDNLRSARATDTYVAAGVGSETYEPRFTYHGFRYVQVEGYPGRLTADRIQGVLVATDLAPHGSFASSSGLVNQIQHNAFWGERTNFHSIPTDCPQRDERQGWMGDAWMSGDAMYFNFDMTPAYSWFMRDIADAEGADGSVPDTVPHVWGGQTGDPMWSAAYPILAWETYLHTGDKRILALHYDGVRRSVDLLAREAQDYIVTRNRYGDWIAVEGTPKDLISTGTFCWLSGVVADMAQALGKADDAAKYRDLSARVGEAFHKKFYDGENGCYGNGSQFSDAFPLCLGIVPGDKRDQVLAHLINDIEVNHKDHLSTGFIGTPFMLDALVKCGRADLAYKIITQDTYPGWGYMIANGATTVWELWELKTGNGMNSHNHPALGFVSSWFYRILAGLNPDTADPGWARFAIKPYVLDNLQSARGTVDTLRGKIESDWYLTDKGIVLIVTIPANSAATVCVPKLGKEDCVVREGKSVIWRDNSFVPTKGITAAESEGDWVDFQVSSGQYRFELTGE